MATSTISDHELHLVAPRQPVSAHLRDIWRFRELLRNLVRKELKVKYKNSVLGFAWSMLNPLFLLAVYTVVFNILGTAFDYFTIWLLIGILVWNLFSTSVVAGTTSISGNGYLVNKVRFPREVLPLASVGAALVHFFLQSLVLVVVLAVVRLRRRLVVRVAAPDRARDAAGASPPRLAVLLQRHERVPARHRPPARAGDDGVVLADARSSTRTCSSPSKLGGPAASAATCCCSTRSTHRRDHVPAGPLRQGRDVARSTVPARRPS